MSRKTGIPKARRWLEKTRRLAKAFTADLRGSLGKPASKRKDSPGAATRPNPWPKCPACFHRVPKLCEFCGKGHAGVTPNHTEGCCPGECPNCRRCRLECPGQCSTCDQCRDRCGGHDGGSRA